MKDEVIENLKRVEEKLQEGKELEHRDIVFLFGLSLLKDKENARN